MAEQEMLPVEQCDREAAANVLWLDGIFRTSCLVKGGERDEHRLVQAFARHRLAATKAASTSLMATARACADHAKARYAAEERVRVLSEHLAEQITHAETRIQDGREMGAAIWRIALEDIVRENRAALAEAGGRHG